MKLTNRGTVTLLKTEKIKDPNQVDYCPDTEEYYWLDTWEDPTKEDSTSGQLTHYHVMLFGVPKVTR